MQRGVPPVHQTQSSSPVQLEQVERRLQVVLLPPPPEVVHSEL